MENLAASPWNVSDRRLLAILALVVTIAALYCVAVDRDDTFMVRPAWTTVAVVNLCAWLCYGVGLWANRHRLVWLDYHMLYLPVAVWFITDLAYRILMPLVVGTSSGRSGSAPKGLTNFFLEAGVVSMLYGLYLLRFIRPDAAHRRVALLARIVVACAAAVALLTPSLGE